SFRPHSAGRLQRGSASKERRREPTPGAPRRKAACHPRTSPRSFHTAVDHLAKEGATAAAKRNAEVLRNRSSEIGERLPDAERNRSHPSTGHERWHVLARMVGGSSRRIISMIGG